MPAKLLVKERAWGTRYDTLGSSPPPSPPIHHLATEHMHTAMSSTFTPEKAATITGSSPLQTPEKTDPNATPHDASIFVGRLANVPCSASPSFNVLTPSSVYQQMSTRAN